MPNQFISPEQIADEMTAAIKKEAAGDPKKERAIWYDLQTRLGGFPHNPKQRKKFIKTGKY